MTIWKIELSILDEQTISLPKGSEILTIQNQRERPCLWAKVDPTAKEESRVIKTREAGHYADNLGRFISTVQFKNGSLVFHFFE